MSLPGTFTSDVCEAETVSLETLIKRKMLISRKSRLQLGVQLAVAIMQLRMSGWLEAAWGKQDIFFLVHKDLQRRDADGNSTPNLLSTSLSFADLLEDSSFQTHCRPDYDPSVFFAWDRVTRIVNATDHREFSNRLQRALSAQKQPILCDCKASHRGNK